MSRRGKILLTELLAALICLSFVGIKNHEPIERAEHVIVTMEDNMGEPEVIETRVEEMTLNQTESAYTYRMLQEDIVSLCSRYPDFVRFSVLGQSVEGRDIYQLILGNPDAPHAIFIQASIHGREYMTTQLVMRMLAEYASEYQTGIYQGIPYQVLFEQNCFYIVPMSNPDGVSISQYGEAGIINPERITLLRTAYERERKSYKNYSDFLTRWKANANGVDLNRNFDAGWEGIHQRTCPSSELYKGLFPESEPETQILVAAVTQRSFDSIISYHARGEVIYYDAQGNGQEMSLRSAEIARIARELNGYKMMNCKSSANVVLGGLGDWTMLTQGIPSITIEIGKGSCPLQQAEFGTIWNMNKDMWGKMACHILITSSEKGGI